jgi:C-terminal processing protease CtpA/Prc
MRIARGAAVCAVLLISAGRLAAQDGSTERDARSRALSERMRVTLEQQARVLEQMQRELQRAARSDSRVRDSIVRVTSQRISELATEISRVQAEADRVQVQSVDADSRAQLRAQIAGLRAMANVTRVLAGQQRALTFRTRSMPRGYLGVQLSGEQNTEVREGKVFTVFLSPAVIASVEAGSPAAEGGLQAGDTLLAFGRNALPGAVPLSDVLTPGERVPLKVRRGGRERVITVLVGTRDAGAGSFSLAFPEGAEASGTTFRFDVDGDSVHVCAGDNCTVTTSGSARAPDRSSSGGARAPDRGSSAGARAAERGASGGAMGAPRPPSPPAPPSAAGPERLLRGTLWATSDLSIAGAVMTTITDDLEDLTGVSEGILVLRVAPGTPAATSGLRGGDVIRRVNDEDCEGVRDLQVAVQRASSRGLKQVALVVVRQRKERPITLQW